jgi:hypothetical protein
MKLKFEVEVEVKRTEGKRGDDDDTIITDEIIEAPEGADPGVITGSEDAEYTMTAWVVSGG